MFVAARIQSLEKSELNKSIDQQNKARIAHHQNRDMLKSGAITKDELQRKLDLDEENKLPELSLVLRADVHGSLEAIDGAIQGLPQNKVKVSIVGSGVGGVTSSDIELAASANGMCLMFLLQLR